MNNLYGQNGTINGWQIAQVTNRIDALVLTLKACKGSVCTRPWETLHPQGDVHSLADAMDPKFDDFYRDEAKVTYSACMKGYLPEYEGVLYPTPFSPGVNYSSLPPPPPQTIGWPW